MNINGMGPLIAGGILGVFIVGSFNHKVILAILLLLLLLFKITKILYQAIPFMKLPKSERERMLYMWELDFSWKLGWYVEVNEQTKALLANPVMYDYLIPSWQIIPQTSDPIANEQISHEKQWWKRNDIILRSREFPEITQPFLGIFDKNSNRIIDRGLSLTRDNPNTYQAFCLWCRKFCRLNAPS